MAVVKLDDVSHHFAGVAAVNNLTLSIDEGEVLGLFGHNGAGKTTTMKLILGLLRPCHGSVSVFGRSPSDSSFSHCRYQLGFLPENVSFYQQLSGKEVLSYFARLKKVNKSRVIQLLDEVGLAEAAGRKVKTYSKGMKQRLALAQALLTAPRLLLLDEPTVGLDPIATQNFYAMVDSLRQSGCSVLLCSHVLPGVEKHIDRAAILGKGRLQALGTLSELRAQAELPIKINIHGDMSRDAISKRLEGRALDFEKINGRMLSINTHQDNKISVLRELLNTDGVSDVEVHPPSLEEMYRYFITGSGKTKSSTSINKSVHKQGEE
ncbi:MAG: ABC transporter ATP-binding protein [Gammaproteobacteria bacterium]|nr:ABC transporter ATP-binding protein [Gammaproteobacteria bacterium]